MILIVGVSWPVSHTTVHFQLRPLIPPSTVPWSKAHLWNLIIPASFLKMKNIFRSFTRHNSPVWKIFVWWLGYFSPYGRGIIFIIFLRAQKWLEAWYLFILTPIFTGHCLGASADSLSWSPFLGFWKLLGFWFSLLFFLVKGDLSSPCRAESSWLFLTQNWQK